MFTYVEILCILLSMEMFNIDVEQIEVWMYLQRNKHYTLALYIAYNGFRS